MVQICTMSCGSLRQLPCMVLNRLVSRFRHVQFLRLSNCNCLLPLSSCCVPCTTNSSSPFVLTRVSYSSQKSDSESPVSGRTGGSKKQDSVDTGLNIEQPKDCTQSDLESTKKPGLLKRFHQTYKQYGKILIGVHITTSAVWAGTFYYAALW